jgi:alkylation response protein AidB-like acyl-CoA dehydrogenase
MDFTISEEQQSVQQLAAQILGDYTDVDRLQRIEQQPQRFDRELWQALAEAGLLGVDIDTGQGGMELGFYALTTLCEEVGRTVAPVPVIPVLVAAAGTLARFGSAQQREAWLPDLAKGSQLVTAALEEYHNEDPAQPRCVAEPRGEGYRVSGRKPCVSMATAAARILLPATTGSELVVLLLDPNTAGVTCRPQVVTSGETCHELVMDGADVSAADVVAVGRQAVAAMNWARQAVRTALCAQAVGLCDRMMRMTGSYTSEREQFGRAIATFQAVSHRLADCFIDVECLRVVTQQAASLIDQGKDAEEASIIAKIWCGDVTHRVSQASQHCHGGAGVDRDYPLFRYCLQARQAELTAGSSARLTAALGEAIAGAYL